MASLISKEFLKVKKYRSEVLMLDDYEMVVKDRDNTLRSLSSVSDSLSSIGFTKAQNLVLVVVRLVQLVLLAISSYIFGRI